MNRVKKVLSLGPMLAFAAALAAALTLWPACRSQKGSESPDSDTTSATSSAITSDDWVPKVFLPHPALAHAKSGEEATSLADVAEEAAPSVVNVSSSRTIKLTQQSLPFFDNPFFRRFFGPMQPPQGPGGEPPEQEQHGLGSGVIVSKDGIVLTNNHVVENADEIKVTTADKKEFDVEVVGTDAKSDLAVLRLKGNVKGLKPIELGDSSRMRLGDIVLAIGNPFGVGQTITMGIVSAKGRANVGIVDYEDFLQTDAAINPGNSGGALVNMEGQLIGVNTAILSRSGGNMGIGFAIPSNMAKPIMDSLLTTGKVVRGWLGVGIQDVNQDLADAMKLGSTRGVLISEVMPDSPAQKAGLKQGDVVLEVNGKKMDSTGRLRNAVAAAGAGAKVDLTIIRDGKKKDVTVKLGELPAEIAGAGGAVTPEQGSLDGLQLESLTPLTRQKFGIPDSTKSGVVVVGLQPGSPAAHAGLQPGDVIKEVNREKVTSVGDFKRAYKKSGKETLLLVARGERQVFIVVKR